MTGHTKEPWGTQPCREDGALFIIGSNLGGLVGAAHAWPTEIDSGDFSRIEANAHRIVDCVNALAGIPDPAAYVAAMGACVSTLERLKYWFDTDPEILAAMTDKDRADNARQRDAIRAALQSARAARGEV